MVHLHRRIKTRALLTPILCACLVLLFSSPSHSASPLASVRFADGVYVPLSALVRTTGGRLHATPGNHKIALRIGAHTCVFTRLSSAFVIDHEAYRLPLPTRYHAGELHIPGAVLPLIERILGRSISLRPLDQVVTSVETREIQTPEDPPPDVAKRAANWTLKTVVVDPGHGGRDPGAIGQRGTFEKNIVLGVAKRLKTRLEKQLGVQVVLTRSDDAFVPLRGRSRMAVQENGKIFISLHCNANENRRANGVEVYFLSEAKTDDAREVAKLENDALKYEQDDPEFALSGIDTAYQNIALSLLTSQFLIESQDLAADIHDALADHVSGITPRGVKQANFYVMRGTMGHMPSVLVELGFITNRPEEKKLRSRTHQNRLSEALYRGIKTFKERYERQLSTGK